MKNLLFFTLITFMLLNQISFAHILIKSDQSNPEGQDISLNGSWDLWYAPQENGGLQSPDMLGQSGWEHITAKVPGNVELDLLAAGKIKNPEIGHNVYELQKYENHQWWYHKTFETPEFNDNQRIILRFDGLDCLGSIWINDHYLGETDNMLIPHSFDVTNFIKTGDANDLYVRIRSAVLAGRAYENAPLEYALPGKWEALNIRKAAHMYGWDIMPRIVSAGLWRDVTLQVTSRTYFNSVYWATQSVSLSDHSAKVMLDWNFHCDQSDIMGMKIKVVIKRNGLVAYQNCFPVHGTRDKQQITLENVDFWWPKGHGDQPLYEATFALLDKSEKLLDSRAENIGIRTIELERSDYTSPEEPGDFVFRVNGAKVFIKGTNWVPLDAFHSRDHTHLPEVFQMLVDLNCNMVRCWGGNVYESKDFFNLCDAAGIMVWQDFSMGCGRYPQTDDFAFKIQKEAETIIPMLRNHPSLALWAGNNENDVSLTWIGMNNIDPNSDRISREVLVRAVRELDPFRPFLPSSPYVSPEVFQKGFDKKTMPEVHLWGPRGYYKAPFYTDVWAHFVSEIGYHGCPVRASLEQMMDPEFVYPWKEDGLWNEQWTTKAVAAFPTQTDFGQMRNTLMTNQVRHLFGTVPDDLDTFIKASQSVQAEAKKFFIESWRMKKWDRTGIMWWNLRDGWPILSDAIVDYYNRKKLAYHFIKRSQENVCIMFDEEKDGTHNLLVVNDSRHPSTGKVKVKDAESNRILFEGPFMVEANDKASLTSLKPGNKQSMWIIEWALTDDLNGINHYLIGAPPFSFEKYEGWLLKIFDSEELKF